MTLGRLVIAWLLVVIWFGVSLWVNVFIAAAVLRIMGRLGDGVMGDIARRELHWRVFEALLLTLFASLWFDSLGAGQWWLVFGLVALLATVPTQLSRSGWSLGQRRFVIPEAFELLRYLVAGALLAWRLS